ncbi:cyclic lactone autoinducer peptide [uncultured Thomasclavelia sp.]
MKNIILNLFAKMLSSLAIANVNSACTIIYGQEKEEESLSRFKKY